jgi:hypothetical protein
MTAIVVSGAIANKLFNGGAAWTRLNWILGLHKLGFDTYFIEQIERQTCVDDAGNPASFECSANLAYFQRIMQQFGLQDKAALVYGDGQSVAGLPYSEILEIAESAALLVNISGHLSIENLKNRFRRKVYIDLDPGFTQFWHAAGNLAPRLSGHDCYFTVGENIGAADCLIPAGDLRWRPTRQPIVLDHWPVSQQGDPSRFTTVASWRGPYGPVEYAGRTFGLKVHQFRKYMEIPKYAAATFEIALDIHPGDYKDRDLLCGNSWRLVDPRRVAGDPCAFRTYVQTSGAEFSVAQEIYVETRSGWFSDRTVRYLASGKPVLVQETGFSRHHPIGCGLLSFSTPEQAIAGVREISDDYNSHARAARKIAETYFDSDRVLGRLLEEAEVCL